MSILKSAIYSKLIVNLTLCTVTFSCLTAYFEGYKLLTLNVVDEVSCKEGQHQCSPRLCIPESWVCDSQPDCPDESDEKQCRKF